MQRTSRIKLSAGKRIACCAVHIESKSSLLSRPIKTAATMLRRNSGSMARPIRTKFRILQQNSIQVYLMKCFPIKSLLLVAASENFFFSKIKIGIRSVRNIETITPARNIIPYTANSTVFLRITSIIYSGTASCLK